MVTINFTVEESNFIAIYETDTLVSTQARINGALPDIYDKDMIAIAINANRKLSMLSESAFAALDFILADETETEIGEG